MSEVDRLVLGAGLAGLAAARKHPGTVVLEARERCGGRVHTVDLGGPVDLGATWIHRRKKNPITSLMEDFGIPILDVDDAQERLTDHGGPADWDRWNKGFKKRVRKVWRKAKRGPDVSLGSLVPDDLTPGERLITNLVADDWGEDLDQLGVHAWDEDEAFKGPDAWVPGGLGSLIGRLADGVDVRHGVVVEEICIDGRVFTNQGTFQAKNVVVALPLGVLQTLPIDGLPDDLEHAIERLSPGRVHTTALRYPSLPAHSFVMDTAFPDVIHLRTAISGHPIAVSHTYGDLAQRLEREGTGPVRLHRLLRQCLGPLPDPIESVCSEWIEDDFTRGAYSSCPPGTSQETRRAFHQRVGALTFAGEHTSVRYPATMHGAWLSGLR